MSNLAEDGTVGLRIPNLRMRMAGPHRAELGDRGTAVQKAP